MNAGAPGRRPGQEDARPGHPMAASVVLVSLVVVLIVALAASSVW